MLVPGHAYPDGALHDQRFQPAGACAPVFAHSAVSPAHPPSARVPQHAYANVHAYVIALGFAPAACCCVPVRSNTSGRQPLTAYGC